MYRLMQLSQTILPVASDFTHLFRGHGKRNKVEFITDFPVGDDAEVVSSLQIHPDGHSAISRNVSNDEQTEVIWFNLILKIYLILFQYSK